MFSGGAAECLSGWLKGYEIHGPPVSIDYQGKGFAGNLHRGLSPGHDILRVFEAVWQIKNGVFRGLRESPDGYIWVATELNQYDKPFDTYEGLEAFIIWVRHLISDFVTPRSLPFPGMSLLTDMPVKEIREFAIALYKNGLNLQSILVQALAPALVEIVVRSYFLGRQFIETKSIRITPEKKQKLTELLLAAHATVVAVNAGKVVIMANAEGPVALRHLNVPAIMKMVRYLIPFVIARMKAHDPVEIIKRNAREIDAEYDRLLSDMTVSLTQDRAFQAWVSKGPVIEV